MNNGILLLHYRGHAGIGQIAMSDVVSDVVAEVVSALPRGKKKKNDNDEDDQDDNQESESDPLLPYWIREQTVWTF